MEKRELISERRTCRRNFIKFLGLTGLGLVSSYDLSWCEDFYPARKITWLVFTNPGGGHDLAARAIAPYLEKHFKTVSPKSKGGTIIIKNEPSGGGDKAMSILVNAPPDGHTIGSLTGAFIAQKFIEKKNFDITKLTFLVRLSESTRMLVTGKNGPKNWGEMVSAAKVRPIKWGVGAFGQDTHYTSISINEALRIPSKFIPFGGTAASLNALIRGDVQMITVSDDAAHPLIEAGEIRPIIYFDEKSIYPGVPSIQDLGHPELIIPTKAHRYLAASPGISLRVKKIIVDAFKLATKEEGFVAFCKKTGLDYKPLYGEDLDNLVNKVKEYYREKAPMIKEQLAS